MSALTLIGAGNMGSAIAHALLLKNVVHPSSLRIADPDPKKLEPFAKKGCRTSSNAEDILPESEMVLLAVKPQVLPELLAKWRPLFSPHTILLSIAAGVSVKTMQEQSGLKKIVRIMPNTPAQVGLGVSGVYFSSALTKDERDTVLRLLESFGIAIECQTEEMINKITALSGSGPAYFFRILEIFQSAGEEFGFSQKDAREIALFTLLGAGTLAKESGEDFGMLREKVTSKGGTTAAALESFETNTLPEVLRSGIIAAYTRAEELSKR